MLRDCLVCVNNKSSIQSIDKLHFTKAIDIVQEREAATKNAQTSQSEGVKSAVMRCP